VTFRSRLVLVSAAAVAMAIVLAAAGIYVAVRSQLRGQIDDALRALAPQVAFSEEIREFEGITPPPLGGGTAFVQIVRADGTVLTPIGQRGEIPPTQRVLAVAAGTEPGFLEDRSVNGIHLRVLTAPELGPHALQLARRLDEVDATLARLRIILLAVATAGIALGGVLGGVVARSALGPVRKLTDATEHVARTQDLTRRIETAGAPRDELARLAASFNVMLEALEGSLTAQRQLVADASHELRTPLTSLRTNIELLARGEQLPEAERARVLDDVVAQLEELTVLVTDVVELARGAEPEAAMEDVRLDQLVDAAVGRARGHAPGLRYLTDLQPSVVRGSPGRLDRAISNLLDNAAKWSPQGGQIEVMVTDGEVTVRDHGPGIDPADLPHVFDRFYRSPSARGTPGSGLGLSIVRQVAEVHGGSVTAEPAHGGGTLFRLRISAGAE
jgi:two-component system, OmpR family, sensor histidine kinase MprB